MHLLKITAEDMTAAPWGDSCKRVHDWECLLVEGSVYSYPRLYG